MAPLNTDRAAANSGIAARSEGTEEEIITDQQSKNCGARNIFGLINHTNSNVCKRRYSGGDTGRMRRLSCSDLDACGDNETELGNRSAWISENSSTDIRHRSCDKIASNCVDCDKKLLVQTRVYHKKKTDGIVRNTSVSKMLYKMSPKWVKTFMNEPEYIMTQVKQKNSDV